MFGDDEHGWLGLASAGLLGAEGLMAGWIGGLRLGSWELDLMTGECLIEILNVLKVGSALRKVDEELLVKLFYWVDL